MVTLCEPPEDDFSVEAKKRVSSFGRHPETLRRKFGMTSGLAEAAEAGILAQVELSWLFRIVVIRDRIQDLSTKALTSDDVDLGFVQVYVAYE